MLYNHVFSNHYLRIKIHTNDRYIHRVTENFLDLGNASRRSKNRINIQFFIDKIACKRPVNYKDILHYSRFDKKNNLLSFIGSSVIDLKAEPETGVVKVRLSDYKSLPKENVLNYILIRPLHFILAHRGFFFLHASMVCRGRDSILISGPQNSGKSTLALSLAQDGFEFLADDDCFVKSGKARTRLFPFPTKTGLSDSILKRYQRLSGLTLKNYRYGGKRRLSFRSIFPVRADIEDLRCKMIIFPKYRTGSHVRMRKVTRQYAVDRLVRENWGNYPKKELRKMFGTLYALARYANCFELTYSDNLLNDVPKVISKRFAAIL